MNHSVLLPTLVSSCKGFEGENSFARLNGMRDRSAD